MELMTDDPQPPTAQAVAGSLSGQAAALLSLMSAGMLRSQVLLGKVEAAEDMHTGSTPLVVSPNASMACVDWFVLKLLRPTGCVGV